MDWTFGDRAAHVLIVAGIFVDLAWGVPSPVQSLSQVNEIHAGLLAEMPERDLPSPGAVVDCSISVEPFSFLMLGYGRSSQVRPVLTGKVIAWGRKPWLAGRFTKVLHPP